MPTKFHQDAAIQGWQVSANIGLNWSGRNRFLPASANIMCLHHHVH